MLRKVWNEVVSYSRFFYRHVAVPYLLWLGIKMFLVLIMVLSELSSINNMTAIKGISETTQQFNQQNLATNFHAIKIMFLGLLIVPLGGVLGRGIGYGIEYSKKFRKDNNV